MAGKSSDFLAGVSALKAAPCPRFRDAWMIYLLMVFTIWGTVYLRGTWINAFTTHRQACFNIVLQAVGSRSGLEAFLVPVEAL